MKVKLELSCDIQESSGPVSSCHHLGLDIGIILGTGKMANIGPEIEILDGKSETVFGVIIMNDYLLLCVILCLSY